jgi:hypothetical protein
VIPALAREFNPSLEEALGRVPRVEPGLVRLDSCSLLNPGAADPPPSELFWPLPPPRRTALLSEARRHAAGIRLFRECQIRDLARWRPEAIAGPVDSLRRITQTLLANPSAAFPLRHSVLAFCLFRRAFLTEQLREMIWQAWGVPVFGQLLGPSGEMLAWECEAHEGYHYDPANVVFEAGADEPGGELYVTSLISLRRPLLRMASRLTGILHPSRCGCGSSLPRLLRLEPFAERRRKAGTASAACAAD